MYNLHSMKFLISVYKDKLKSLQKMAFPVKVNTHFPPLLLFSDLSENPLCKGCLSYHAVWSIQVQKVIFCFVSTK